MTDTPSQSHKRALLLLLLLVAGRAGAAAGSTPGWTPDCSKVSSGCESCSYRAPSRIPTFNRGLKQTHASQRAAAVSGGGSRGNGAPRQVPAQHGKPHGGGSSGSNSGGSWSWGGSNVWWTPGAVLTCTACDISRGFELVTSPNGTTHCGECRLGQRHTRHASRTANRLARTIFDC